MMKIKTDTDHENKDVIVLMLTSTLVHISQNIHLVHEVYCDNATHATCQVQVAWVIRGMCYVKGKTQFRK